MKRPGLFGWGFGSLGVGVAILAMPASVEGPVLVHISPGHAVAWLDALGAAGCTSSDQSGPLGLLQKRHFRLLCRVMRRSEILSPPCG